MPIGLVLGIPPQFLAAFSIACIGIYFFPANGSQVTAIATDETGTTGITKYAIWHSFSLPMFVMWIVVDRRRPRGRRPGVRHVVTPIERTDEGGRPMNAGSAAMWWGLAAVAVAALMVVPLAVGDDDDGAAGFDGYIQSGTCAHPSDDFKVDLESDDGATTSSPTSLSATTASRSRSASTAPPVSPASVSRRSTPTSSSRW